MISINAADLVILKLLTPKILYAFDGRRELHSLLGQISKHFCFNFFVNNIGEIFENLKKLDQIFYEVFRK